MKVVKLTLIIALAAAMTIALAPSAKAFHSGGVAECVGCHSMHEAAGGALLTMSDASSTCLDCHEGSAGSYHVSTAAVDMPAGSPPLQRTPGGDFGWLRKVFNYNVRGPRTENGEQFGHNIIAADFGYVADSRVEHNNAPGGTFPNANLSCTSCHDQHSKYRRLSDGSVATTGAPIIAAGSYNTSPAPAAGEAVGVYRLLRGALSNVTGTNYTTAPPAAITPSSYNRAENVTMTRVAYGANMSKFCAGCHPDMHTDSGLLLHPVEQAMSSTVAGNYGSYVGSGDLTGTPATSYDSLVPFVTDNTTDHETVLKPLAANDDSVLGGPAGSVDRVFCLSCHRAHASGWEFMTRWDNEIEMIVIDGEWPGTDATSTDAQAAKWSKGRTQAERSAAYNDRLATDYATYQRVLCNKCHAKD